MSNKSNFPKVTEEVFGPNPDTILKDTDGKPSHFYYICAVIFWLWVCAGMLLYPLESSSWEHELAAFIVEYLSHDERDTIRWALVLIFFPIILTLICLRAALYPRRKDGVCRWRWKK